jgi:hypothetical protein
MGHFGARRGVYGVLVWKPEEKSGHLEDIGIDGKILLEWILNWMGRDGLAEERD